MLAKVVVIVDENDKVIPYNVPIRTYPDNPENLSEHRFILFHGCPALDYCTDYDGRSLLGENRYSVYPIIPFPDHFKALKVWTKIIDIEVADDIFS